MNRRLAHPTLCLIVLFALVMPFGTLTHAAPAAQSAIASDDFTVTLGDGWHSSATITYPAGSAGRLPTLLLTYPTDKDFTVPAGAGFGPGTQYFKDLAESFSAQGIAVVRYNSRYITDANDSENAKAQSLGLPDHLADIERVVAAVRKQPRVDPTHVFVYGWSTSSVLAANVAAQDPKLAGVILQGTVSSSDRQLFIDDYLLGGLPYALSFSTDGRITGDVLKRALDGPSTFAKFAAGDFADATITTTVQVNPLLDTNKDGVLDPDSEIKPNLGALVDSDPAGQVAFYRAIPSVCDVASQIRIPVLMLQGEEDTAVRASDVRKLAPAFAANRDYTAKFYPGLGHALAPKPSQFEDYLISMTDAPKADIVAWVKAHGASAVGSAPVTLPNTGGDEPISVALSATLALLLCVSGALLVRQNASNIRRHR